MEQVKTTIGSLDVILPLDKASAIINRPQEAADLISEIKEEIKDQTAEWTEDDLDQVLPLLTGYDKQEWEEADREDKIDFVIYCAAEQMADGDYEEIITEDIETLTNKIDAAQVEIQDFIKQLTANRNGGTNA